MGSITPSAKRGVSILKVLILKRKGNYYTLSQEDFELKIKQNQKVPLDLSGVVYVGQKYKYDVRCTKHDHIYTQGGQALIKGVIGCKHCLKDYKSSITKSNKLEFITKFNNKFPSSGFDFESSDYVASNTKMLVVCGQGHSFYSKPNNLLSGYGCPICYKASIGHTSDSKLSSYLKKFEEVHGGRYLYTKVTDILGSKTKIDVMCKEHGVFKITPDNHVQGKGCPLCGNSGYQPQKAGTFYILKVTENIIKFGITNKIERRLAELQKHTMYELSVLYRFDFNDGYVAQNIENLVYQDPSIIRRVVSKADMPQGYVETTYAGNISKILEIVETNKPT